MKWLAITCLFLAGCGESITPKYMRIIPEERVPVAAEFIVKLCEVSNPRSDEEPEDMIREAHRVALELYGVQVLACIWRPDAQSRYQLVEFDNLTATMLDELLEHDPDLLARIPAREEGGSR